MPDNPSGKSRGCFFYGCLTGILVFFGVVIGLYFGIRQAVRILNRDYTASAPAPVPQLQILEAEKQRIAQSIRDQADAAAKNTTPPPLTLNETELNVLLAQSPELKSYVKQIYLKPEDNTLKAQVSIPLDQFNFWKAASKRMWLPELRNRYLNGLATFDVASSNGQVTLFLKDMLVNGKSLPKTFIDKVKTENLARNASQDPKVQPALNRVQNIEVKDSKVIVHFKSPAQQ
jgi:hypothetical protein